MKKYCRGQIKLKTYLHVVASCTDQTSKQLRIIRYQATNRLDFTHNNTKEQFTDSVLKVINLIIHSFKQPFAAFFIFKGQFMVRDMYTVWSTYLVG